MVVKQAPKTRFNFYNSKIDICVFIFIKISQEYYHEISRINTANVGINPQTSLGSTALGFMWINTSVLGIHFFTYDPSQPKTQLFIFSLAV